MIQGNNFVLFEGYQNLSISSLNINAKVDANQDVPQGIVSNVNGAISYEGGITGTFNAILEKVNGEWQIDGINVTVPPNKFHP